jgi:hypothetical protein
MKPTFLITIGRVLMLLTALSFALILVSCSTVSVTRMPNGAVHAGATSFVGKQTIGKATLRTIEGDVIEIEGYSTQNPDPETTKTITNGVLINTGIKVGGEVLDTGIKEGSKLINTAIQ